LGEIFAWILYMLIENLQGFKTFLVYLKALLGDYFKLSIKFLESISEKMKDFKKLFSFFYLRIYASLLA
jgi:hypothetical protein